MYTNRLSAFLHKVILDNRRVSYSLLLDFIYLFAFCFCCLSSEAGIEGFSNRIEATDIVTGTQFQLQDDKYFFMQNNPSWSTLFNNNEVSNRVVLEIDPAVDVYIASPYTVDVELSITYFDEQFIQNNTTCTLTVSYDNTPGIIYDHKHSFSFTGGHLVQVSVTNVSTPAPANLALSIYTTIDRIYAFDYTAAVGINAVEATPINYSDGIGELALQWDYLTGAESFDLEWTWVSDVDDIDGSNNILVKNPSDILFDFRYNSTRISTAEQHYQIPLTFERGYILYRVRGVGRDLTNPDKLITGYWSLPTDSGNITEFIDKFLYAPSGTSTFAGHEQKFNWQYNANFAEDGKRKESISYFDGSLRNRQVVSKLNTEDLAIAGMTIYDHQGRAAIQVLPAPTFDNSIKYYDRFTLNSSGEPYERVDFDTGGNGNCIISADAMSVDSGASRYYSTNNPDQSAQQAYVPDAEGYPFTHIEFTPDNTGRIRRQSGVGPQHKIGSEHETKYFYGKPFKEDIDRLFGSEVGYASHYKKNVVRDANGQFSVSYLDQQGRVIATALLGDAPQTMDSLENTPIVRSIDIINNGVQTVIKKDEKALLVTSELLVAKEATYTFYYSIAGDSVDPGCLPAGVCYDCVYDLAISVQDECGIEQLPGGTIVQTVGTMNTICDPGSYATVPSIDAILKSGNYSITKRLTISQNALDFYLEDYLSDTINCVMTLTDFITQEMTYVDFDYCDFDCSECSTKIGPYTNYNDPDKVDPTHPSFDPNAIYLTQQQYDDLLASCQENCNTTFDLCQAGHNAMLADVSPGGQYADYETSVSAGVVSYLLKDPAISILNESNILPQYMGQNRHWRNPYTSYKEEDGVTPSMILNSSGTLVVPQDASISLGEFINNWNPSWAASLVNYHPEYCYYDWCKLNKDIGSNDYDQVLFNKNVAPSGTTSDEYLWNPLGVSFLGLPANPSDKDPYFEAGGQGAGEKTAMDNSMRQYYSYNSGANFLSIWELAYISVHCNNYQENLNEILTCLPVGFNYTSHIQNDPQKEDIWFIFKSFYSKLKQKLQEQKVSAYAITNGCYNKCIGSAENTFDPTINGFYSPAVSCTSNAYFNPNQICNSGLEVYFAHKQKRFPSANDASQINADVYGNDAGILNELEDKIHQALYLSCGLCPVGQDLGLLFNRVIMDGQFTGITFPLNNNYPEFTPTLYDQIITVPQSNTVAFSWNGQIINNTTAVINFNSSVSSCSATVVMDPVMSGNNLQYPSGQTVLWNHIETLISLTSNFNTATNNFDFIFKASFRNPMNSDDSAIIVSIGSSPCFKIDGCNAAAEFGVQCVNTELAEDLMIFLNTLVKRNELTSTTAISLNACPYDVLFSDNLRIGGPGLAYTWIKNTSTATTLQGTIGPSAFNGKINLTINNAAYTFTQIANIISIEPVGTANNPTTNSFRLVAEMIDGVLVEITGNATRYVIGTECSLLSFNPNCPTEALGEELVQDGTFDDIPSIIPPSFTDFTFEPVCSALNPSEYTLLNNAFICGHPTLKMLGKDHTTGLGKFALYMMNNAGNPPNDILWEQTVPVQPDSSYHLKFYFIKAVNQNYGADNVLVYINNVLKKNIPFCNNGIILPAGVWLPVEVDWQAGSLETTADIRIEWNYGACGQPHPIDIDVLSQPVGSGGGTYTIDTSFAGTTTTTASARLIASHCLLGPCYNLAVGLDDISFRQKTCVPNPFCEKDTFPDIPNFSAIDPCLDFQLNVVRQNAEWLYSQYKEDAKTNFTEQYVNKCLQPDETFTLKYNEKEYHYTLYYFDQAGNLIKTIPPVGVVPITDTNVLKQVAQQRDNPALAPIYPAHTFVTNYQYNSLNQLTRQTTVDGGQTRFFYDILGRLIVSQNAKQDECPPYQGGAGGCYSYTLYDNLGRITEVGEVLQGTDPSTLANMGGQIPQAAYTGWLAAGTKSQITKTVYDIPTCTVAGFTQKNLRTRVSCVNLDDDGDGNFESATHYSYDIHGNVKSLLQDIVPLSTFAVGQQYKRIDYEYDLVSGNVNAVHYQNDQPDQFHHYYEYDADNRITNVYTSTVNSPPIGGVGEGLADQDAKYFYYHHGPLARIEIGDEKVQAMDYAYTLQGWLKGVNSNALEAAKDLGKDGLVANIHSKVARDAASYSLGYYNGDYKNVSNNTQFIASTQNIPLATVGPDLFNGNISHMATTISPSGGGVGGGILPQLTTYRYDQLNRIKQMRAYHDLQTAQNEWTATYDARYESHYTYDANGNLLTLSRNGEPANLPMDNLSYTYQTGTNKLDHVADAVTSTYLTDIDNQAVGNYNYDEIGNLIADAQEEIAEIKWTVYGKVKEVVRTATSDKSDIEFKYDGNGNRIAKVVKPRSGGILSDPIDWIETYYTRDAAGNIMAIYEKTQMEVTECPEVLATGEFTVNLVGNYSQIGAPIAAQFRLAVDGIAAMNTINITNENMPASQVASIIAGAINTFVSTPEYTATSVNDKVIVQAAPGSGASANGLQVTNLISCTSQQEVQATGEFRITSVVGSSIFPNPQFRLTINGQPVMLEISINYQQSINSAANSIANAINSYHSGIDYTATSINNRVIVQAPAEYGDNVNGFIFNNTSSCSPFVCINWQIINNMQGGVDGRLCVNMNLLHHMQGGKDENTDCAIEVAFNLEEQVIYGSSRVGVVKRNLDLVNPSGISPGYTIDTRGVKQYELSNHLGNVLSTVNDKRIAVENMSLPGTIEYYTADVVSSQDFYAFGSIMPSRGTAFNISYAFGFNGKLMDNEWQGNGNSYDFGARMYNPRIGRWLRLDPLSAKYVNVSPYHYVNNSPIQAVDPDGKRTIFINGYYNERTSGASGWIVKNFIGSKKGRDYWSQSFIDRGKEFLNDQGYGTVFVDGRGKATSTSKDRFDAGYEFAKSNFQVLTEGMLKDENGNYVETMKIVTHSQGGAYGEGVIKYLEEQGVPVETVVHLSTKQPEGFTASQKPKTYQLGYENDPVVDENTMIKGVDNFGVVETPDQSIWEDITNNHARTKFDPTTFDNLEDLRDGVIKEQISLTGSPGAGAAPGLPSPVKQNKVVNPQSIKHNTKFEVIEK